MRDIDDIMSLVTSESAVRTKRERHDLDYKKTMLSLAKQHRSASDLEKVDRYYMPADDKVSSLAFISCILVQLHRAYMVCQI